MTQIPTTAVAEFVTFRLAKGVTQAQFVELSAASESFVRSCPGFIERRLSCSEDGSWTDCVLWSNMDSAKAAGAAFPAQSFAAPLIKSLESGSETMRYESVLWHMPQGDPSAEGSASSR